MTGGGNRTANITGLIAGSTYSISIVAKCSTLPSYPTTTTFTLSMCSPTSASIISYVLFIIQLLFL